MQGTGGAFFRGFDAAVRGTDAGLCGSASIDAGAERVVMPGNVIIAFDQSESMSIEDLDGQPRWKAASDALARAIAPHQDALTVGAVFFPTKAFPGGGIYLLPCDPTSVAAIDDTTVTPPQIPFMPGPDFLVAWKAHWNGNSLTIGTPTEIGLERARDALSAAHLSGASAVILVTDGEPTCGATQNSIDVVADLKSKGIPTYVIGLPGAEAADMALRQIVAASGGTSYFSVSDQAALEGVFESITTSVIAHHLDGCSLRLSIVPPDPAHVYLIVTLAENAEQFSVKQGPDTWSLKGDTAMLLGSLCQDATNGRFSRLTFEMGCVTRPELR
jgi:hypothetical protein